MEDNFKHKGRRRILASELREKGIKDQRILSAIENIPRHLFIDPGLSEQAYIDKALPIENDQTISQPYTVAFQTQLLNPSTSDKILEIGTGSGYQTAVLDYLNLDIYTIERDHALYVAYGPYRSPRYAISILIEHGGSGGSVAAPLAKKLFKKIIDRHEVRKNFETKKYLNI